MISKTNLKAAMRRYEDDLRSNADNPGAAQRHLERELKLFSIELFKLRLLKARAKFCLANAHRYV